eukprot:jgi/Botrbrau1/10786/Bobra.0119s0012.1
MGMEFRAPQGSIIVGILLFQVLAPLASSDELKIATLQPLPADFVTNLRPLPGIPNMLDLQSGAGAEQMSEQPLGPQADLMLPMGINDLQQVDKPLQIAPAGESTEPSQMVVDIQADPMVDPQAETYQLIKRPPPPPPRTAPKPPPRSPPPRRPPPPPPRRPPPSPPPRRPPPPSPRRPPPPSTRRPPPPSPRPPPPRPPSPPPPAVSCPKTVPTIPAANVCGTGSDEVTVWDLMYAGSSCFVSLGPLPSDLSTSKLYACDQTLYGKTCTGMKDKLNILFFQQQPTSPTVLQISSFLTKLGIAGLTQVGSLGIYLTGTPSPPIQPSFLPSLAFITGDLIVSGNSALRPLGLGFISSLGNLQQVGGNLLVQATAWTNAASLFSLSCVGNLAAFVGNANLVTFGGLERWASVNYKEVLGTRLLVFNNTGLTATGYFALRNLAKCPTGATSPLTPLINATASVGTACPKTTRTFTGICRFAQQGTCVGVV